MQRGRCHLKPLPRKRFKVNKKNSSHRLRVTFPDDRWCGNIKDPDNHGARSIPANNPSILSVISSLGDPEAPDAGIWEDGPTLILFSYWALSPDSKHLPCSLCPCVAHTCWAALPHLPLETTPKPVGPCTVHLPCDRHPCCVQAVDPRSPSPFQWLSTKEVKLLCTENNRFFGEVKSNSRDWILWRKKHHLRSYFSLLSKSFSYF